MPVPTTITDLSVATASNTPVGGDQPFPNLDDYLRAIQAILRRTNAKGTNIASASTVDIGGSVDGDFLDITHSTGTTTITSLGTIAAGIVRTVRFVVSGGTLKVAHNANIIMPSAAEATCTDNDIAAFRSLGSGVWVCESYPNLFLRKSIDAIASTTGTNTYAVTIAGATATNGQLITVDFGNVNTLAACTLNLNSGGAVDIRGYKGISGMNCAIGSLVGVQRLRYSSTYTCWIALDVRDLDYTNLGSNQPVPVGYRATVYGTSIARIETHVATGAGEAYQISASLDPSSVAYLGIADSSGLAAGQAEYAGTYQSQTSATSGTTTNQSASSLYLGAGDVAVLDIDITISGSKTFAVYQSNGFDGSNWFAATYSTQSDQVFDTFIFYPVVGGANGTTEDIQTFGTTSIVTIERIR
jgi:hypothetical protein